MKRMKKLMALVIAVAMVLAMGVSVFAQTVDYTGTDGNGAKITVNNPAKGESYAVHKLFGATVKDGKIAYKGESVPDGLTDFFEARNGYIYPKASIAEEVDDQGNVTKTKMTPELQAALEAWATDANITAQTPEGGSTGDALEFTNLPYGYYVLTTSHTTGSGETAKSAITVTSTIPNAEIYDKNSNEPSAKKDVEHTSYSIGDTVKYTATFDTTNYMGSGESSKPVVEYVISDTLPEFLSNVVVTQITIGGVDYKVDGAVPQFSADKTITIPWVIETVPTTDHKYTHRYADGVQIVVKYQGKLTSTTKINGVDKNTVSIRPSIDDGTGKKPWDEEWKDSKEIVTYAAALKKTDGKNTLAGAKFKFTGLTVTPAEGYEKGVYVVTGVAAEGEGTEVEVGDDGMLYILGLAQEVRLTGKETVAPDGYNLLSDAVTLTPQVLEKEVWSASGERQFDADGNLVSESSVETTTREVVKNLEDLNADAVVVVNKQGPELPTTGGIGTTIFYIIGAILVVGGGILLVSRRRMSSN